MREGYAEVMVDAGIWKGLPQRWWRAAEPSASRKGMSGQALVDWVYAMAATYPGNVRLS